MVTSCNADASAGDDTTSAVPPAPLPQSTEATVDDAAPETKERRHRLVMSLAEYVAELRSGGLELTEQERLTKFGSIYLPIPVPLFVGETDEQYDQAFLQSLTDQERQNFNPLAPMNVRQDPRFHYARMRAEWYYLDDKYLKEIAVTVEDLETLGLDNLPRAVVCVCKYVKRPLYRIFQLRKRFFHELKTMSPTDVHKQYGTALVPVYMPLDAGETPLQCEERFVEWLQETKRITREELVNYSTPLEERRFRIEFAAAIAMYKVQSDSVHIPMDNMDSTTSLLNWPTSTTHGDAFSAVDPWQNRRVLRLPEYIEEIKMWVPVKQRKRAGKNLQTGALIPIPLFAGETEEEYKRAFAAMVKKPPPTSFHLRGLQRLCARERVRWCKSSNDQRENPIDVDDLAGCCVYNVPRSALYAIKYLPRSSYERQVLSGFFDHLKKWSRVEVHSLFGTLLPPAYMPEENEETQQQCEERFAAWLRETKNTTVEELVDDANPLAERTCRIEFAKATGILPKQKKRKRSEVSNEVSNNEVSNDAQVTASIVAKKMKPSSATYAEATVADFATCGCQNCLMTGMKMLKDKASSLTSQVNGSISTPQTSRKDHHSIECNEAKLLSEYEDINERVVMNEKVLDESAAQLAASPVSNMQVTSQLLDENDDFRALIEDEINKRNSTLALLIVCVWRDEISKLESMVGDSSATNVQHIHRASHHKCAELTSALIHTHRQVEKLKATLNASTTSERTDSAAALYQLKLLLSSAENELKQRYDQRRREFERLIHFDERVRLLIQELLNDLLN